MPLRYLILFLMVQLLALNTLAVYPAQAQEPIPTPAPTPPSEPEPQPGVIQQVFHYLSFPADTISDALALVFNQAAEREGESLNEMVASWATEVGEIIEAPGTGFYRRFAESGLPTAAALAPALFLLRLALYHWARLAGGDDSSLHVMGDWVTAGTLALAAGPFLDLAVRLGWWMSGMILGETAQLAQQFFSAVSILGVYDTVNGSLFSGLISLGLVLGGVVSIAAMLYAFVAARAALFVMAVTAAPVAVISVVPQMRWLRALWLKAIGIIALLPVVAGGIFKATLAATGIFPGGGLLAPLIRLIWLIGAAGFLLSLAGILSRLTLSASLEVAGQVVGAVGKIASVAALAASGAGAAASASASPTTTSAGVSLPGISAAGAVSSSVAPSSLAAALTHMEAAQTLTRQAAWQEAFGLRAWSQQTRAQVHDQELSARQAELRERMLHFTGPPADQQSPDALGPSGGSVNLREVRNTLNLSEGVFTTALRGYGAVNPGDVQQFAEGFTQLNSHARSGGRDLSVLAAYHPRDIGRMVRAYTADPQAVEAAAEPLLEAARRAAPPAGGILRDVYGETS